MTIRSHRSRETDAQLICVVYARVSTPEQAEKDLSNPTQLDAMYKYAKDRGHVVLCEYVEPGASAYEDRRPVFRKMIADVTAPGSTVSTILCCYTSRFYRNATRARALKEVLRKKGIRVIAIYQETSDDPMGQLVEGMFELIDEYESLVNGMRTSDAMRKNAKLGYFNGAKAPFGFQAERIEVKPDHFKRKIVPNPEETETHNEVFRLYVAGNGAKGVARELNQRGVRYRDGRLWTKDRVIHIIGEHAAIGEYRWGMRDSKTGELRPTEEWIIIPTEPIIDRELFEMAQQIRMQRDPERNPGRTGSSPMLLAGLVTCGKCGASYQLETSGKNAQSGVYAYRYYNCRNSLRIGVEKCGGHRVRSEALEKAVLEHLADRLFTMERCRKIVADIVEETGMLRQKTTEHRRQITRELAEVERRIAKWQEGWESGDMPKDLGTDRVRELASKRAELTEMLAKVVPLRQAPAHLFTDATIRRFQDNLRGLFLGGENALTRNYLRFLVEGIVVTEGKAQLTVRTDAAARVMAAAPAGGSTALPVDPSVSPTFVVEWLQR